MNRYFLPSLNHLAAELKANAKNKGFTPATDENLPEKLMLIVSEIAEAMEDHRAGKPALYMEGEKPCGWGVELIDAMIRILDIASDTELNVAEVLALKAGYNETRPVMHGGKRY